MEILNVISVYASQTGCAEEEKDDFWRQLDQEIINIPNEEPLLIGGVLNGHVEEVTKAWRGYMEVGLWEIVIKMVKG